METQKKASNHQIAMPDEKKEATKEYHKHKQEFDTAKAQIQDSLKPVGERKFPEAVNELDKRYTIHSNEPLPELDTALAKAFVASDKKEEGKKLYALITDSNMPPRGNVIQATMGAIIPFMVTMHAVGVTEVGGMKGRRFVIIYDRPRGKSLSQLMTERGKSFSEKFIIEEVIAHMTDMLQYFSEMGLSHGRINPSNIFYEEYLTIGECAIEPCGYSQPYMFEPPERAQAHPAGKGESMPEHDYYSIGVLATFLRLGDQTFERAKTPDQHILRLLRLGSYNAFSQLYEFSDVMTDLLRGTLNDRPDERWNWQQLKPLATGRRYNMLPPAPASAATRPFEIERQEYYNLRDLAHGLYNYWNHSTNLIKDGTLLRWIDLSARRKDVGELIRRGMKSLASTAKPQAVADELVARTITTLDPQAPLSFKDVRAHPSGLGSLLAEGYRTGNQPLVSHVVDVIEQGLPIIWADMYKRKDEEPPGNVTDTLWLLDRMRMILRMPGLGFGVERMLYDLNPDLPCMSPILNNHQCYTLGELLETLDVLAAQKMNDLPPLDEHIAAFIASKLSLSRRSSLSEYRRIPYLAEHPAFVAIRLFEMAQDNCGKPSVPGLSGWVCTEALSAAEQLHSKSLRKQMYDGLVQLAPMGQFTPLSRFINQREFASGDLEGFKEAIENYHSVTKEIFNMRDRRYLKRKSADQGYSIAKYLAHFALLIAFLYSMQEVILR